MRRLLMWLPEQVMDVVQNAAVQGACPDDPGNVATGCFSHLCPGSLPPQPGFREIRSKTVIALRGIGLLPIPALHAGGQKDYGARFDQVGFSGSEQRAPGLCRGIRHNKAIFHDQAGRPECARINRRHRQEDGMGNTNGLAPILGDQPLLPERWLRSLHRRFDG